MSHLVVEYWSQLVNYWCIQPIQVYVDSTVMCMKTNVFNLVIPQYEFKGSN